MKTPETIERETAAEARPANPRRHRRGSCDVSAEAIVRHRGCMFRGEILNISQSGCFVVTKAILRLERYSEVELRFSFNNADYRTTALVMNLRPGNGVGLEFSFEDARTEKSFQFLIEELIGASPKST